MKPLHLPESLGRVVPVMGTTTRFLLTARDTGGQFTLYRICSPVGGGVPRHTHQHEDETFLIRSGQVKFMVEDRVIIANPGDTVFGPRGIAHSWEVVGSSPSEFDIFTTPSGMETMFDELGAFPPGCPMDDVLAICQRAGITFG